jgi:elongation factor P
MINYADIKLGKILAIGGDPLEVVWTSGVVKKQRQKPHNTAKMRNLRTGATTEQTFTQSDKVSEADLGTRQVLYLYTNRGESMFCDPADKSDRFVLSEEVLGTKLEYILENSTIDALTFNDEIISIKLPNKVNLRVAEAPPNIRGNTSAGGNKVVVLETGLRVTTPLFINAGDMIRVNTETGAYSERVIE